MIPVVQTVCGAVDASQLGVTDAHEHLATRNLPEIIADEADLKLDDPDRIVTDLAAFHQAGGCAIAEMTTIDYGRDVTALRDLSNRSKLHIIAATGFNKGIYCRRFCEGRDPRELARTAIAEIRGGVDATGIRCGVVKFGASLNRIDPWEEIALRSAAITHLETGAPIVAHTEAGTMAEEQLELLGAAGVRPAAVILCHLDRAGVTDRHVRLAERGAFLSYDQIPKSMYGTEPTAIAMTVELARRDLHRQVVLGGDFARRRYFAGWDGQPGLVYLLSLFRAHLHDALQDAGLDATRIMHDLFVHNPARAFAFRQSD